MTTTKGLVPADAEVPRASVEVNTDTGLCRVVITRPSGFTHEVYRSFSKPEADFVQSALRVTLDVAYLAGHTAGEMFTREHRS